MPFVSLTNWDGKQVVINSAHVTILSREMDQNGQQMTSLQITNVLGSYLVKEDMDTVWGKMEGFQVIPGVRS